MREIGTQLRELRRSAKEYCRVLLPVAEDEALLADAVSFGAMSPRTPLAVRYRLAQKKIIHAFDRFLTALACVTTFKCRT